MCLITGLFPPEAFDHLIVSFWSSWSLDCFLLKLLITWLANFFLWTFLLRPTSCLLQLAVLFAYLHNHWAILYVAGYHNHWTIRYVASCVSPNNVNLPPDLPPTACDLQYSLPTYRVRRVGSMGPGLQKRRWSPCPSRLHCVAHATAQSESHTHYLACLHVYMLVSCTSCACVCV